jgi:hypothetical protein
MVRIVQTLAKQDVMPLYRALFFMMNGHATYKALTRTKEEIGVIGGESK